MRILVDADAFPVVSIVEKTAKKYEIPVILLCDIHQSGKWYTNENIDQMLMERHLAKKARNAKKKHRYGRNMILLISSLYGSEGLKKR